MQEACDGQLNRPDYNNWHKFWRHHGESKVQPDDEGEEQDSSEPLMSEVADDRIFRKDEIGCDHKESYDTVFQWIRRVLRKPAIADAFIATKIDGVTIRPNYSGQGTTINRLKKSVMP